MNYFKECIHGISCKKWSRFNNIEEKPQSKKQFTLSWEDVALQDYLLFGKRPFITAGATFCWFSSSWKRWLWIKSSRNRGSNMIVLHRHNCLMPHMILLVLEEPIVSSISGRATTAISPFLATTSVVLGQWGRCHRLHLHDQDMPKRRSRRNTRPPWTTCQPGFFFPGNIPDEKPLSFSAGSQSSNKRSWKANLHGRYLSDHSRHDKHPLSRREDYAAFSPKNVCRTGFK